jgi:hypothetical protein
LQFTLGSASLVLPPKSATSFGVPEFFDPEAAAAAAAAADAGAFNSPSSSIIGRRN